MMLSDIYRDIDSMNCHRNVEKSMNIPSSLPDNMEISPNMVISPSPAKTDWIMQFDCGTNKKPVFR